MRYGTPPLVEMYYTVQEAALCLRLSDRTVKDRLKAGDLGREVVDLGTEKRPDYRIPATGINGWLARCRVFGKTEPDASLANSSALLKPGRRALMELYYTVVEVAGCLRLTDRTVKDKSKAGDFGSGVVNVGTVQRPDYRIPATGINAWLATHILPVPEPIVTRSVGQLRRKAAGVSK
jgi:hypothetical protein